MRRAVRIGRAPGHGHGRHPGIPGRVSIHSLGDKWGAGHPPRLGGSPAYRPQAVPPHAPRSGALSLVAAPVSSRGRVNFSGLGADLGLRFVWGVLLPVVPCWRANVGAECFMRMSE